MKTLKRLLSLALAAASLAVSAFAVSPEDWILKYNSIAPGVNAPFFPGKEGATQSEDGMFVYSFSDKDFLAVYFGAEGHADGLLAEVFTSGTDAKALMAAALAASDENISADKAYAALREVKMQALAGQNESYAYFTWEGWIFMLNEATYAEGTYSVYTAIRESAYESFMTPATEEAKPETEEKKPEPKEEPAPEAKGSSGNGSTGKKIYKI